MGDNMITFGDALKLLNIEDFTERIFNSSSTGELMHVAEYGRIAEYFKDNDIPLKKFRPWFLEIVRQAEEKWSRPESAFQHIGRIFSESVG